MDIDVLFASLPVKDLDVSRPWYDGFFGRPADIVPNNDEVMWRISDSAWLYVIRDGVRAGHGVATFAVPNIEQATTSLTARGVAVGPVERVGDDALKAIATDPDGNSLALIEVAAGT